MTDNIFDRLAELLESSGPVNWRLAAQIAESVAGAADPVEPWVAEEYEELSRTAALLVGRTDLLDASALPPTSVTDGRGWATANVEGYAYLADPLAGKLSGGPPSGSGMGLEQLFSQLGPALVGMQVGSLVGAVAASALGQFDAGLPPLGTGSFVIVPAVETMATDAGLDVRQARLWVVVREAVHQAVLAVPWLHDHLAGLVADYVASLEIRPDLLQERFQSLQDPSELERLLSEPGGLTGFTAGEAADEARSDLTALLALLDGFGRVVAASAAGDLISERAALEEAAARRYDDPGPDQALEQMVGIVVDRSLAAGAAEFCEEIARRWGPDAWERLWAEPVALPTESELDDPLGWAARALLPDEI